MYCRCLIKIKNFSMFRNYNKQLGACKNMKKLLQIIKKKFIESSVKAKVVVKSDLRDFSDDEKKLYDEVKPYTMTSPERIKVLADAVRYIVNNQIQGDFVECGVWKGGSVLAILKVLLSLEIKNRNIFLFDTFEGMSEPTELDVDPNGNSASTLLEKEGKDSSWIWAKSVLDEVRNNLQQVNYPKDKLYFIKGKVEDTLSSNKPEQIALLRLDTDWYESTKVELEELFDHVVPGGIIIIDDYGHWAGCKKAVDEFLAENDLPLFLNRIDYTGRLIVKP